MTASADLTAAIRADGGRAIGQGHIMRCLTLARALRPAGIACRFVCRAHEGHMAGRIEREGFPVTLLPVDPAYAGNEEYDAWRGGPIAEDVAMTRAAAEACGARLLITDHYGLDIRFEREMRAAVPHIAVFDDLYDRRHDCDLLIDQNIGHRPEKHAPNVAPGTRLLVGADYAPLREDFAALRDASLERRGRLERPRTLLIAMGGFDHFNVTREVLRALGDASENGLGWVETAHVVLGSAAPYLEEVRALAAALPCVELHVDTQAMPDLMRRSDLAIGGSGVTAIERCVMGLPTLLVVMADNQEGSARQLEELGAARVVGHGSNARAGRIAEMLNGLHQDAGRYRAMSAAAAALCDGRGLSRIVPEVVALGRRP